METGEPIRVWEHPGARRVRRWRNGHAGAFGCVHVAVGVLPDGRWFVERGEKARAYPDEAHARVVASNLMTGSAEWREVPAELGPDGRPTAPGWVRRGGEWHRDEAAAPTPS